LKEGAGICNFKALKYETRTPEEQKRIEDLVIEKMGVWKYSLAQIKPQIHSDLFDKIMVRWDLAFQTVKDIFEQQLRQLVPSLTEEEVKKALQNHTDRMIPKLNTCFILMNNSESVIRQASDVWKDVYHLRQSEHVEIIDDISSDDEPETQGQLYALADKGEEDKEEEAHEEDLNTAAEIIASLPHTPPYTVTSVESASTGEIASSTVASITQSPPSTSQLRVPAVEVQVTSSTELYVSSSTEHAPVHLVSSTSTILTSQILSTPILPVTSVIDIPVWTLPSVSLILSAVSVLDSLSISMQPLLSPISSASPSSSTIVSIPKVNTPVGSEQPLKLLLTGKEISEDIDLDTEIAIPKIDYSTATIEEMMMISQLLEKKARKKQIKSERDKEFAIIANARDIITEAIGVEVDSTQHILL